MALYSFPLKVDLNSTHSEIIFAGLNRSYALWRDVWQPTLNELDGTSDLASDGFSRQDYCSLIEIDGEPAGLCCFRVVDLTHSWTQDDSWFTPWPKEILHSYSKTHRLALVPSWLTVAPAFRKMAGYSGPNLAGLLSEIIALNIIESVASIGFGTPRKDRSMHYWIERAGGICVVPDILHHGVQVELVAFYPEYLRQVTFSKEVLSLWSRRSDFRHRETKFINDPLNEQERVSNGNSYRTV